MPEMHRRTTHRRAVAAGCAQSLRDGAWRHRPGESGESGARAWFRDGAGPWRPQWPAASPGEGEARHLSVHGWRAVADGDVRLQATAQPAERRAAPRLGAARAAAHRHVRQSIVSAAGGIAVRVQPARGERHMGERSAARNGEDRGRPVHRPIDVHRSDQSRPGDHVLPDRLADRRPAEHGLVDSLRVGQRQRRSAGIRRAHYSRQSRPAALLAPVGQRVPAVAVSGRAVPERQGRGVVSGQSRWRDAREAGG